jgi:hypothetical protein
MKTSPIQMPLLPEQEEWLKKQGATVSMAGGFRWMECPNQMSRLEIRGYASVPGTGPLGRTCGDCQHAARFQRYAKCELCRAAWKGSRKTDILLRAPACSLFETPKASVEARA